MHSKNTNHKKSNLSLSNKIKQHNGLNYDLSYGSSYGSNSSPSLITNSNKSKKQNSRNNHGFTIVELIVVIVIIGILAAITIVSYTGISAKANVAAITSDLDNAKKQFALYYTEHGVYPTGLQAGTNCPTGTTNPSPDTNYCLKPSSGTTLTLNSGVNGTTYSLRATKGSLLYSVSDNDTPAPTIAIDSNWLTIGSQTWAKNNLNTGTMVTGVTAQTNNSTTEKYCYSDLESNCTTYGALYQWDEAMQYTNTENAQGICPTGSHIPSDNDWKILEVQLGMTQAQADTPYAWRGTDQGTQLKAGGSSGLNMPLAGYRDTSGPFGNLSSYTYLWSSSESSTSAWFRVLYSGYTTVYRTTDAKANGFSVRCLGN